eukprot:CAMPEP_0206600542 /NCGR_PEP_ID=MMETSP0325_2-20121206/45888_1 /ASSEMBLY_ACC=CAM_ASM_000347 /TAXON_ID=2866 /ORGANISM="Crypthecodinium cohnii, Strain Seligo" /LENGTH=607 /DNA_ID=CAMNT_0054111927 /DNA_START=8 /DNA_END=1828 /DNA_ORIENTATION=+
MAAAVFEDGPKRPSRASRASEILGDGGEDSMGMSNMRSHFDLKAFMPERVGAEISKRYEINAHEIGSGGYGKVFVAKDRQMKNRLVAIKKVSVVDDEKKKAFQREVEIMKDLDHPNICKLLETYEQGRFMFFVMEFCGGGELFDRIADRGMIEEDKTADIIKQAATALNYAHSKGIAHRDMKPENIVFCTKDIHDNHIKVIDWGLGFYFGGMGRMRSKVGSLTYAAPEVLEARDYEGYTSACDLWSLGVVTYVMLCGKPPFWGNFQEQLRRMKKETFPMHDATWQAISSNAKEFIKALLKNDPRQRMSLENVLSHPWLHGPAQVIDPEVSRQVLSNMRQFSSTSQFFSLCVASVARQLDHRSLRDVHRVFSEMDLNGDGVLSLHEVRAGFEKIFGPGSEQVRDIEMMFSRLDLDGSGTLDYTEFCAAGIGERLSTEEHVLWAAFKAFDINDDDNKVSKDEIKKVLLRADVNRCWTDELCSELASELFDRFDRDKDGTLDFEEWLRLMRDIAYRHNSSNNNAENGHERRLLDELSRTQQQEKPGLEQFDRAYTLLKQLDARPLSPVRTRHGVAERSLSSRALSGTLQAVAMMRANTPACLTCSPTGNK